MTFAFKGFFGYRRSNGFLRILLLLLAATAGANRFDDLRIAREALDDGLHALARGRLERLLERAGSDTQIQREAFELLLRVYHESDDVEGLKARLANPPEGVSGDPPVPWLRYWQGRLAERQGDFESAYDAAVEALAGAREPESALRAGRFAAQCLLALGRTNDAFTALSRLETAFSDPHPHWPPVHLEWAEWLFDAGQYEVCLERLARVSGDDEHEPIRLAAQLLSAEALWRLNRTAEAEEILQALTAAETVPRMARGEAALRLSRLLETDVRLPEAIAWAREAKGLLRDTPLASAATLQLAMRLLKSPAEYTAGMELLRELADASPQAEHAATARLALADALRAEGRYDAAVETYQLFLEVFADTPLECRALWGLGWSLLECDRPDEAALAFERAHDVSPNADWREQTLSKMADALFAAGRFDAAAEAYRAVLDAAAEPANAARAALQAGESLLRAERLQAAETVLETAFKRFSELPDGIEAGLRLGLLRAARGAANAAIDVYNAILAANPNDDWQARALQGRGRVYYRTFQFTQALADFDRVRALDTKVADEATFLRAMTLYWKGSDQEAHDALESFLERFPNSPLRTDAVFWQGRYAYNRKQFDRARERFEFFAVTWPDHPLADDALLWATRAAFAQDAYGDALTLASQLVDRFPDSPNLPDIRYLQGETLTMQARFEDAVLAFQEIITRYPDSNWVTAAWGRKGDCLYMLGKDQPERYAESVEAYKVVIRRVDATQEAVLQAAFKVGRSLEKLERIDEALEWYYAEVILRYQEAQNQGVWHNEAANAWFARAVFQSADLLEARRQWGAAIRVLQRIVLAGVQGSEEARERIRRISREHRWSFPASL